MRCTCSALCWLIASPEMALPSVDSPVRPSGATATGGSTAVRRSAQSGRPKERFLLRAAGPRPSRGPQILGNSTSRSHSIST